MGNNHLQAGNPRQNRRARTEAPRVPQKVPLGYWNKNEENADSSGRAIPKDEPLKSSPGNKCNPDQSALSILLSLQKWEVTIVPANYSIVPLRSRPLFPLT